MEGIPAGHTHCLLSGMIVGNLKQGRGEVSDREYIKSLVTGAELYSRKGLYEKAEEKYLEALSYVSKRNDLSNPALITEIAEKKIHLVDEGLAGIHSSDDTPELTGEMQDFIKELFSFSSIRETAAFEGAVALMKFGQYKRALEEFDTLLAAGIHPLASAKNIISCSLLLGQTESAIARFGQWRSRSLLTNRELSYVQDFLRNSLLAKGIEPELPRSAMKAQGAGRQKPMEER